MRSIVKSRYHTSTSNDVEWIIRAKGESNT